MRDLQRSIRREKEYFPTVVQSFWIASERAMGGSLWMRDAGRERGGPWARDDRSTIWRCGCAASVNAGCLYSNRLYPSQREREDRRLVPALEDESGHRRNMAPRWCIAHTRAWGGRTSHRNKLCLEITTDNDGLLGDGVSDGIIELWQMGDHVRQQKLLCVHRHSTLIQVFLFFFWKIHFSSLMEEVTDTTSHFELILE